MADAPETKSSPQQEPEVTVEESSTTPVTANAADAASDAAPSVKIGTPDPSALAALGDTEPDLPPPSPIRRARAQARATTSEQDTLLSAPETPDPFHDMVDERLRLVAARLDELEDRVKYLERRAPVPEGAGRPWLFWLLFLVCLLAAWQLVLRLR